MQYNTAVRIILEFQRHNVTIPKEMKMIILNCLNMEKTRILKRLEYWKDDHASLSKGYKDLNRIGNYIRLVS